MGGRNQNVRKGFMTFGDFSKRKQFEVFISGIAIYQLFSGERSQVRLTLFERFLEAHTFYNARSL